MEKIIYSRFSNERAPEFNICTQILEDQDGQKKIIKRAYQNAGQEHIDKIYDSYLSFVELYKNSIFEPNICKKNGDILEFEFLNGDNLEEILDKLIIEGKVEEAKRLIQKYVEELKKSHVDGKFEMSNQFKNVFGDIKLIPGLESASYCNIDLIFQNIIVESGKWNIIDYEWTFDFSIPVNYIIFRALFYFEYENPERRLVVNDQLYRELGIEPDQIICYKLMESNFQKYLQKGYVPLRDRIAENYSSQFRFDDLIKEKIECYKHNDVQVYFDFGDGFSEDNSTVFTCKSDSENTIKLEFDISNEVCQLRLDPAMSNCAIQLVEFEALDNLYWYDIEYTSNGCILNHNTILFDTQDPQITVTYLHENTKKVRVVIKFFPYNYEFTKSIIKALEKKEYELNQLKKNHELDIATLNKKIQELQSNCGNSGDKVLIEKLQCKIASMELEKNQYLSAISAKDKILSRPKETILDKVKQINNNIKEKLWKVKNKIFNIIRRFSI